MSNIFVWHSSQRKKVGKCDECRIEFIPYIVNNIRVVSLCRECLKKGQEAYCKDNLCENQVSVNKQSKK